MIRRPKYVHRRIIPRKGCPGLLRAIPLEAPSAVGLSMSGFCCLLPRLPPARAAFFSGCRCCRAALADHRGFCCQQRPRHWRGRQRWQQQQQHQPWQPFAAPAPPQQHPMGICSSAPAASACTACTNTNTGSSAALGRQVGHVVYAGVSLSPAALRLQHKPQWGVSMN